MQQIKIKHKLNETNRLIEAFTLTKLNGNENSTI